MRCPTCKGEMDIFEDYEIKCMNTNCNLDGDILLYGVNRGRDFYDEEPILGKTPSDGLAIKLPGGNKF